MKRSILSIFVLAILLLIAGCGSTEFEYSYDETLGGLVITKYTGTSPKVLIPEKIKGESVVGLAYTFERSHIETVSIPDSVTSIGDAAFYFCIELTSVFIPNNVTHIGDMAFGGCTGLTSVTIPYGVTNIGFGAFASCTGLTSLTIPDSVTDIGEIAFAECTGLTTITIPENVTHISSRAFYGCTGLTGITIPEAVTYIGDAAFDKIPHLAITYRGTTYTNNERGDMPQELIEATK